jgi:hypothetical protein
LPGAFLTSLEMAYCRSCDREFPDTTALRQHLEALSQHAAVCLRCLRSFNSTSARKQRILNSSGHNICTDCSPNRDFITRDLLDEHAEVEHNCCTTCNIKFKTPRQLFQHDVAKHDMCETCQTYFDSPSNLKSVSSLSLSSISVTYLDVASHHTCRKAYEMSRLQPAVCYRLRNDTPFRGRNV